MTAPVSTTGVPALTFGDISVDPPVVLAPMAGVTNQAFRVLCGRFGALLGVTEMVTARALVEGHRTTRAMVARAPGAATHSVQLYGVDPQVMGAAVRILTNECGADHIDVNVGCPAAKVTRKGGGAALPAHPVLFGRLMEAAVAAAGAVPVTVKMRMGLNDEVRTDITAATLAADAGVAAVTLHARTAEQLYAGPARWAAIAELVEAVGAVAPSVPVLGNGDIFSGVDATRMMATTGCAGVVVGRGVLGRPWLFAELAAAFAGEPPPPPPTLATVIAVMGDHLALLVDHAPRGGGNNPGAVAVRDFRKHVNWYLHGFPVGRATRQRLMAASTPEQLLAELSALCDTVDGDAVADPAVANQPRGHTHGPRPVSLPDRWLEFPDDPSPPRGADALVSGG